MLAIGVATVTEAETFTAPSTGPAEAGADTPELSAGAAIEATAFTGLRLIRDTTRAMAGADMVMAGGGGR